MPLVSRDEREAASKFGDRVRALRRMKRLTQERLAEMVQIDTRHLQRIEAGEANPGLFLIVRLAKAFGITPSRLI